MADVTRIIGIDFGTSTSVVCVKRYQNGEALGGAFLSASVTFGNGQGDTRAHTIVRRNGDGTYTCGREAGDEAPGAEIFREFKMDLENPDEGKRAQARALTEEFFKYLYRWYDHQRSDMGGAGDKEKTLVSYPAKWSEDTRQFMAEAAKKAGFPDVRVMDEPSAALYATLTRKMNDVSAKGLLRAGEPGYMLLIDMGAGTTDLAVCRYTVDPGANGVIRAEQIRNEIVSTWPESAGAPTFGGREVDRILEGYLTEYIITCGLPEAMARQLVCGANAVKGWKEDTVSARLNEGNTVDTCGFLSGYMMLLPQKQPFPAIDRGKFQELLAEKLEDFKSLVTGCLDKASELEPAIAQNGVDLVVLTGGHSAWYFTEELLNGAMPGVSHPALKRAQAEKARVMRLSNPQETVALGLVYSMLPMKVEKEKAQEQKKAVAELENVLKETIKKKEETTKKKEGTIKKKAEDHERNQREQSAADAKWAEENRKKAVVFFRHYDMYGCSIDGRPEIRRLADGVVSLTLPGKKPVLLRVTHDGLLFEAADGGTVKTIGWKEIMAVDPDGLDSGEDKGWSCRELDKRLWDEYNMYSLKLFLSSPGYDWDDRLFPVIDDFFFFFKRQHMDPTKFSCPMDMRPRFRNALRIPVGDQIYMAHCPEYKSLFSFEKKWTLGWAVTSSGIYSRYDESMSPEITSWLGFLNGKIGSKSDFPFIPLNGNDISIFGGFSDMVLKCITQITTKEAKKVLVDLQGKLREAASELGL